MTESIITISPKTSSYNSQIRSRVASPGSSSTVGLYVSSSRSRSVDHPSLTNEKSQLRKLNDQFLSYIERVRLFETYNNCLTTHSEQIKTAQERTKTKLDLLKQEFDEYQQERFHREKKDIQLENESINQIEKQVGVLKNKQHLFQHEHEQHRKQIIDLQKQSVDLQAKTEKIRFDYDNLNDDNNHYRKQISYYQLLKSSILDELTRQRDIHQRTQSEVEDLKMQKQMTIQTHEADTQAIQIHNDNILYDLTTSFRFDGNNKNVLNQMLNEIREEYKTKDNEMREELHRKYLYEYNQHVKKQVDQNLIETNREDLERRHLSNELNSLHDNRLLLRQKLTLIQEHYKQLEMNIERERKRKKDIQEQYDDQINHLRLSVQEYENLVNDSSLNRHRTIENEVNKYRQLLEGSDQQIGLRQLINMSNKIDHISSVHRPSTPPPPPPPPSNKFESSSSSTLLLLPSRTRQSSISEASYETAPISQSTTPTTNQPYLTLGSIHDKLIPNDYDTDNDQSQTIQYMSGRSSRLTSETDSTPTAMTPTNQESLPPLPPMDFINPDETIVEIPIDTFHTEAQGNQTLPFIPMNILSQVDMDEYKNFISDEQQSPLISTLENREEIDKAMIEPSVFSSTETIIPITIDVDSKPVEELIISKIISPSTPTMSVSEQSKPTVSPTSVPSQPETTATVVEAPVSALPATNPLAKLISNMLPNVATLVPNSNVSNNRPISPTPMSASFMNNDAPPFIPTQHQHGGGQQHMSNTNAGHWGGPRGGGGNRRGQSGGGGFQHGGGSGGGNQRSGGGGNWQQGGGGGQQKQRRGQK